MIMSLAHIVAGKKIMDYYFSLLTAMERRAYQDIVKGIECRQRTISLKKSISADSLSTILRAVNYDHPEFYFVDFHCNPYQKRGFELLLNIQYLYAERIFPAIQADMENRIDSALKEITGGALYSPYQLIKRIHNYLVKNVKYDFDALQRPDMHPEAYSISGAFTDHLAVCEGIAKAFHLLCSRLNIDSLIVFGKSSSTLVGVDLPHAWNMCYLDNQYVQIDVTWDITASSVSRHMRYDYFCLSDEDMLKDHCPNENYPMCDPRTNLSYFYQTCKLFSSPRELKEHVYKEISTNADIIYFKLSAPSERMMQLHDRANNLVEITLTNNSCEVVSCEMAHNLDQGIFFYRINRRDGG